MNTSILVITTIWFLFITLIVALYKASRKWDDRTPFGMISVVGGAILTAVSLTWEVSAEKNDIPCDVLILKNGSDVYAGVAEKGKPIETLSLTKDGRYPKLVEVRTKTYVGLTGKKTIIEYGTN